MESNNPIEILIAEDNPGDGRLIEEYLQRRMGKRDSTLLVVDLTSILKQVVHVSL